LNSELCARGWAKSRPLDSNAPGRGAADCLKPAPPRHRTISIAVGILLTFLIAGGLLTLFWSAIHGRRRICHQQEKRCRRRCRSHVIPSRPPSRLTTDVARITPATAGGNPGRPLHASPRISASLHPGYLAADQEYTNGASVSCVFDFCFAGRPLSCDQLSAFLQPANPLATSSPVAEFR